MSTKKYSYAQYKPVYGEDIAKALYDLVKSGSFLADFKKTEEFEQKLVTATDTQFAHAVNNGTIAISLALKALNVRAGDYVIVPNLTMIATATAVEFIGAIPILCDVEKETACLNTDKAIEIIREQEVLGARVKAVIYVTLNGRCNENKLISLYSYCKTRGIGLIKDDAQSFCSHTASGLSLQNKIFADIHTLSFSPHKIISCGQGGALLTNNEELGRKIARLKDFGREQGGADIHEHFGINSKFTELQAVVGIAQMNRLNHRVYKKKSIYFHYYEALFNQVEMFQPGYYTPWFVDIYLKDKKQRDFISEYLNSIGIGNRKMYPSINTQEIYKDLNSSQYSISNSFSDRGLWLPSSFNLELNDIDIISEEIKKGLKL